MIALAITSALSGCAVSPMQSTGQGPTIATSSASASASASDSATAAASTTTTGSRSEIGGEGAAVPSGPRPAAGATSALIALSQQERDAGDFGEAAATIERALSISPEDALLWVELGEIRMAQGDWQLAEEMARKALTLTGQNSALAARARRLISR